jgi:hypothetical protein
MSVAVTAVGPAPEQAGPTADAVQLGLAQTTFLMYEQGNSQAAALLTDVEDAELVSGNRLGDGVEAVLIMLSYVLAGFTGSPAWGWGWIGHEARCRPEPFPRQPGLTPTRRPHELWVVLGCVPWRGVADHSAVPGRQVVLSG